jgi:plasmid stabilization system protein ParE
VKLFVQESAEQDILHQVEWYAKQGLPDVARRFQVSALQAIDALVAMPEAGAPLRNPRLDGLRSWPVKGFDEFRVYYLADPEILTVVRVLHGKRDIGNILESKPDEGASD